MTSAKTSPFGAPQLVERLRKMFAPPAWLLLEQLRNGTGFARKSVRYCDAVAMAPWPSRGLTLVGFEIKVSRNDWLTELKHPEKAEEIAAFMDQWWLVVADKDIVAPGELPKTWGLMAPHGDRLRAVVHPAEALRPKPIDRLLMAAILRGVSEQWVPASEVGSRVARDVAAAQQDAAYHATVELKELRELREQVKRFEQASGFAICGYKQSFASPEAMGTAARLLTDGNMNYRLNHARDAVEAINDARDIIERLCKAVDAIDVRRMARENAA